LWQHTFGSPLQQAGKQIGISTQQQQQGSVTFKVVFTESSQPQQVFRSVL
jgi:hypothetical protein